MNKRLNLNNKGFGLLEVLISISLLTIIIIPFSNLLFSIIEVEKKLELKQQMVFLAQKCIENIKVKSEEELQQIEGSEELVKNKQKFLKEIKIDISRQTTFIKVIIKDKVYKNKVVLETGVRSGDKYEG